MRSIQAVAALAKASELGVTAAVAPEAATGRVPAGYGLITISTGKIPTVMSGRAWFVRVRIGVTVVPSPELPPSAT